MKNYLIIFVFIYTSCTSNEKKTFTHATKTELTDISAVQITLPYAEGSDVFTSNCMTCHSLAYINMQPDFPKKTWQKIVDKMTKSFGAPISDSSASKIVDYLVAIKGKQ